MAREVRYGWNGLIEKRSSVGDNPCQWNLNSGLRTWPNADNQPWREQADTMGRIAKLQIEEGRIRISHYGDGGPWSVGAQDKATITLPYSSTPLPLKPQALSLKP